MRVLIFYHINQRDISGANEACIKLIIVNCKGVCEEWRKYDEQGWQCYLRDLLDGVDEIVIEEGAAAVWTEAASAQNEVKQEAHTRVVEAIEMLLSLSNHK